MVRLPTNQEVLTSAQHSAGTGTSSYVNGKSYRYAIGIVYITAKSGSPTLRINLQCSPIDPASDSTKWRVVYQEELLTNAMIGSTFPIAFGGHVNEDWSGYLRIGFTVAGTSTPKVTFSANVELK